MIKIIIIGDVHGKFNALVALLQKYKESVSQNLEPKSFLQIGDFGLGFGLKTEPENLGENFKFIRGNHDNPRVCQKHPNYLGEFGYIKEKELFYISGAWSIDYAYRIMGRDIWEDEELNYGQLSEAIDLYKKVKPKYMISHECPSSVFNLILTVPGAHYFPNRTSIALNEMFLSHQPEQWYFGHYHIDKTFKHNGTIFNCIAELSTLEVKELGEW